MPLSHQLDWAPTLASVDGSLATAGAADAAAGTPLRDTLADAGPAYDARYDASVDTAKGAFLTSAQAAHDAADHACRYAESLVGTLGAPLTFDPYDPGPILNRIGRAREKAASAVLAATLAHHTATVVQAYARSDSTGAYFDPVVMQVRHAWVTGPVLEAGETARLNANAPALEKLAKQVGVSLDELLEVIDARLAGQIPAPKFVTTLPGVRELELAVWAAVTNCNAWLALRAYP